MTFPSVSCLRKACIMSDCQNLGFFFLICRDNHKAVNMTNYINRFSLTELFCLPGIKSLDHEVGSSS